MVGNRGQSELLGALFAILWVAIMGVFALTLLGLIDPYLASFSMLSGADDEITGTVADVLPLAVGGLGFVLGAVFLYFNSK